MDKSFAYIFSEQILKDQRNATYRIADFCLSTNDFMDSYVFNGFPP